MAESRTPRHPLFIVGMPRSGTTLLSSLLSAHSEISISPETHFYTRCRIDDDARESVTSVWERLQQQPGVQDMDLTEAEVQRIHEKVDGVEGAAPPDLFRALCSTYAERSGASAWGEKTPDHLAHVPTILQEFPDAAVLCIVRDPRDVCLSLDGMPWNRDSLPESAWKWRRYAQLTNRFSEGYQDRFLVVRYEDLLEDPETTMRRVCDCIGTSFEKGMLTFHEEDVAPADSQREPWKKKIHDPIDPQNTEKWRGRMPVATQWVVQMIAEPYLEEMGYPRAPVQVDVDFVRDLLALIVSTLKTVVRRTVRRLRTPPRPPGDHTPTWIRRQRE